MKTVFLLLALIPFIVRSQTIDVRASDTLTCFGRIDTFTATISGTAAHNVQWLLNGTVVGTDSTKFITGALHNHDTVLCHLTNGAHNIVFATSGKIVVKVDTFPDAGIITGSTNSLCVGDSTQLTDTVSGGIWKSKKNYMSVSNGLVKGIHSGGFECSGPGKDTVLYIVSNACGIDTARKAITVNPLPYAYFELGSFSISAFLCADPFIQLKPNSGRTDFMCEGALHVRHGFVDFGWGGCFGVKAGTDTVVNVSSNSCGIDSFSMTVYVSEKPKKAIASSSTMRLCEGAVDSVQLLDNSSVAWLVEQPNLAVVNPTINGARITGKLAGSTQVTLRTSNQCGFSDTSIQVKIDSTPKPFHSRDSVCSGYSIYLNDSVSGGIWETAASDIMTLNKTTGLISGIKEGGGQVIYMLLTGCADTMQVAVTNCTREADCYPNPATDELTIHLFVNLYHSFALINTLGQVTLSGGLAGVITKVNVKALPKGIYYLKLIGDDKSDVLKMVKE